MHISFIIGNGFDLALGLKTKYSDFIENYISSKNINISLPKPEVIRIFKEKINDSSKPNWSDGELAMGMSDYALWFGKDNCNEYAKLSLLDFNAALSSYLRFVQSEPLENIERLIEQDKKEVKALFSKNILNFERILKDKKTNILPRMEYDRESDLKSVSFISLNYTAIVSKLYELALDLLNPKEDIKGNLLNRVLYPHGSLGEGNIVAGVSDSSQIKCSNLKGDTGVLDLLIKSRSIHDIVDGDCDRMLSEIDKSDIVVAFGTSFGETDKVIWQRLWNRASVDKITILMTHKTHEQTLVGRDLQQALGPIRNVFTLAAGYGSSSAPDRLYIMEHEDFFNFNMIAKIIFRQGRADCRWSGEY